MFILANYICIQIFIYVCAYICILHILYIVPEIIYLVYNHLKYIIHDIYIFLSIDTHTYKYISYTWHIHIYMYIYHIHSIYTYTYIWHVFDMYICKLYIHIDLYVYICIYQFSDYIYSFLLLAAFWLLSEYGLLFQGLHRPLFWVGGSIHSWRRVVERPGYAGHCFLL